MDTSSSQHPSSATTRWSIVARALRDAPLSPRDALGELCVGYWYPVYAYARASGHAPPIARDIARTFLEHLLDTFRDTAPPSRAHFRRFLIERLGAFLAADWHATEDAGAAALALPQDDVEARYLRDCREAISPESAFQRCFALEVLARALDRLSAEAEETGHLDMYRRLAPYLARDPAQGETEALARRLGTRTLTVAVALKRLRQRLRELVGDELAETVTSADELDTERDALYAALRAAGGAA